MGKKDTISKTWGPTYGWKMKICEMTHTFVIYLWWIIKTSTNSTMFTKDNFWVLLTPKRAYKMAKNENFAKWPKNSWSPPKKYLETSTNTTMLFLGPFDPPKGPKTGMPKMCPWWVTLMKINCFHVPFIILNYHAKNQLKRTSGSWDIQFSKL